MFQWYSIPLVRSLVTCRGQTFQDFKTHSFCVEGNFKYSVCHISYNEKPFTMVSIYRNPDSAIGDFLNKFQKLYFQVFARKIKTCFSVDFNIDVFSNRKETQDLVNAINKLFGLKFCFSEPTRITQTSAPSFVVL